MTLKKFILIATLPIFLISCSSKTWTIIHASSVKIPIDNTTDAVADLNYKAHLQPLKQQLGVKMNVVIGQATETMKGHAPESLLSNFSADVYRQAGSDFLGQTVDISIVNLGGLRTVIPEGNITVGKVFELMPFENELVILWLKGDKLQDLIQFFARVGGEGVSGIRMEISNGKAVNVSVNGNAINPEKVYSIATSDYLAGGNDKMVQLAQYVKRQNTGIKLRDILLTYIKHETDRGNKIQATLDGRTKVVPNP